MDKIDKILIKYGAVLKQYKQAREDCKELLFRSITADSNEERKKYGQEFQNRYKILKALLRENDKLTYESHNL